MLRDPWPFTEQQVAGVAVRLQAFFETLDADERQILQALLLDFCGNPEAARCLLLTAAAARPRECSPAAPRT